MCVACLAVEYVSGIDGERQFLVCLWEIGGAVSCFFLLL
jgi:hypothetical protein